jgi:hypothetical protein
MSNLEKISFDIAEEQKVCQEYELVDPWSATEYYAKALAELLKIEVDPLDVDLEYKNGEDMFSALDLMMAIQIIKRFISTDNSNRI